jgi:hypothetical protein
MSKTVSNRTIFLFGAALGAWLNIWPAAITPMGSFIFAYILVFACLCSVSLGYLCKKEKSWD